MTTIKMTVVSIRGEPSVVGLGYPIVLGNFPSEVDLGKVEVTQT